MKTLGILVRNILFGFTLLVLGHGTMSWACSCIRQTTCGVHRYLDADFFGEVLSRRVMTSDDRRSFDSVLFQVRVIESFRGTEKAGDIVGIRTGFGGGDCGYRFEIGVKYLIDASRNGDGFITGICSLTAPLQDSEVELRSLHRNETGPRSPHNNSRTRLALSGVPAMPSTASRLREQISFAPSNIPDRVRQLVAWLRLPRPCTFPGTSYGGCAFRRREIFHRFLWRWLTCQKRTTI